MALALASLLAIGLLNLYIGRGRAVTNELQRRVQLQAWHLHQFAGGNDPLAASSKRVLPTG